MRFPSVSQGPKFKFFVSLCSAQKSLDDLVNRLYKLGSQVFSRKKSQGNVVFWVRENLEKSGNSIALKSLQHCIRKT